MAQLPADRTKLALAQSNQVPSAVASSQRNKDAITEAYDTIDKLFEFTNGLLSAGTLSRLGIINVKDNGAKGDGVADDTAAIQSAINAATEGSIIFFPRGKYLISSITINKPLYLYGSYKPGSTFGVQGTGGTVLKCTSLTQDAIKIDASSLPLNKGLAVSLERLTIIGNSDIVGATSGGGINLIGDKTGEAFFVESCGFKDVHIRDTKGSAWTLTGTVFSNEWYSCSSYNAGQHGLYHDKGNGNPVNNNFYNCKFWNSVQKGFHSFGGKCTLIGCNISQNLGGGLYQNSGYMIITDCDFEENTGTQIEIHSSSPSTRISGGMIHKSPGKDAATGITIDNLCLGINVTDVLFANYDHVNDRLFTSAGGSFNQFNVRQQSCLPSSFPVANYIYIEDKSFKRKIQTGAVSIPGSGIGVRTAMITFTQAFEQSYIVCVSVDTSGGLDPSKVIATVDYDTQNLTQIRVRLNVNDASYGTISVKYIAIGI